MVFVTIATPLIRVAVESILWDHISEVTGETTLHREAADLHVNLARQEGEYSAGEVEDRITRLSDLLSTIRRVRRANTAETVELPMTVAEFHGSVESALICIEDWDEFWSEPLDKRRHVMNLREEFLALRDQVTTSDEPITQAVTA